MTNRVDMPPGAPNTAGHLAECGAGERPLDLVFASHSFMGSPFVVGSHHLSRLLAGMGHRVVHFSTPITPAHGIRLGQPEVRARFTNWIAGGREAAERVIDYVPMGLLPWQLASRLPGQGSAFIATLPSIRRVLARHGVQRPDALLIDQPYFNGLEKLLRPRCLVYRATDLYQAMTGDGKVAAAELALVHKADFIVATSQPVLEHLLRYAPDKPALLIENGVDYELFAEPVDVPPEYAAIPTPRLVYAGAFDERFDLIAVQALARSQPASSIVLIGPVNGALAASAAGLANVHLLGTRRHRELAGYFQHAQLGLLPLSKHPANDGRSPMKLFEYGAAGLPVIATWTSEMARRALPFVFLAADAPAFCAGASSLLADDERRRISAGAARRISADHSWRQATVDLLQPIYQRLGHGRERSSELSATGEPSINSDRVARARHA